MLPNLFAVFQFSCSICRVVIKIMDVGEMNIDGGGVRSTRSPFIYTRLRWKVIWQRPCMGDIYPISHHRKEVSALFLSPESS